MSSRMWLNKSSALICLVIVTAPVLQFCRAWQEPGQGANAWTIVTPKGSSSTVYSADIACSGGAGQANHGFTVKLTDPWDQDIVWQSTSGTSTPGDPSTWTATLTEPQGGWTSNNVAKEAFLWLYVADEEEDVGGEYPIMVQ